MKTALTRLRIAGFKSFAEPVSLDILPGLTGIVGPNGCGKSNVVEALRWAMGETSARSLRGGDMDDVIFAGTVARPSRNLAEVTITLAGELPEPFAAEAELAVTRRIERGAGSGFRANGRELRARDVQTLYADLASGARSSGMVSQGRVAALVGAKPEERRQVLEEAAGITGLHARRHEAELKLRATEQNLARAEDLRTQLEASRDTLQKQARAAARYRNMSGLIRAAEAEHLGILHGQAEEAQAAAEAAWAQAAADAAAAVAAVEQAVLALAEAEAAIPGPRAEEAACRSTLERRRLEAETLAAEVERATAALAEAEARSSESRADLAEAQQGRDEAAGFTARLAAEQATLESRASALPELLAEAERERATAAAAETLADQAAQAAADAAAKAAAAAHQAEQTRARASQALDAAHARLAQCRQDHDALAADRIGADTLAESQKRAAVAAAAAEAARQHLEDAETLLARATAADAETRGAWQRAADAHQAAASRVEEARRRADAASAAAAALEQEAARAEAARVPSSSLSEAAAACDAAHTDAAAAEAALSQAEQSVRTAEAARLAAAAAASEAAAAYMRAQNQADEAARRAASLADDVFVHRGKIAAAQAASPDPAMLAQAEAAEAAAAGDLAAYRADAQALAQARAAAEHSLAAARAAAAAADAETLRHEAEIDGLRAALAETSPQSFDRATDALTVPPGLEAAVAAALGEASDHALDPAAPRHWAALPTLPAATIPDDATALAMLVEAPAALSRALSHALLIGAGEDGAAIQAHLLPGQIAVTTQGDCWRWDGLVTRAGAPAAAARLRQRNRLHALASLRDNATLQAAVLKRRLADASLALEAAQAAEAGVRCRVAEAEAHATAASEARAAAAAAAAHAMAMLDSLRPALARLEDAHAAADQAHQAQLQALRTLADPAACQEAADAADAGLVQARAVLETALAAQQRTRAQALRAQDDARRIAADAAAAAQRVTLIAAPLIRARADHALATKTLAEAEAFLAGLEAPARLLAEAEAAASAAQATAAHVEAAREARSAAEREAAAARSEAAALAARHDRTENALAAHFTLLAQAVQMHTAAAAVLDEAIEAQSALPDPASLATGATHARAALAAARQHSLKAAGRLQALESEASLLVTRQGELAREIAGWHARLADAERRCAQRAERAQAAARHALALADAPKTLAERATHSAASLDQARQAHESAASSLADAEARVRAANEGRHRADAAEADSRAALARAEGARDAARGALAAVQSRMAERLEPVDTLPAASDLSDAAEERARRRAERLAREREAMGPVNLRADIELAEIEEKAGALERERDELTTAVAKLRGAIGHLNREGRARLTAVFTEVNRHFASLFTRMMGGGRAQLALTGSEDPLLAGLEIYAEPPGKKLSTLSLLSGGEQALTALSLIFAVFRCTPAPISVLDEVDAPLDDANVDRFCALLDEIVRDTGTRFLVVTHHQLTMSRMDRLYGVTMQERGVSRLLSVDLQRATALIAEAALEAAE
jgi:chromosome segregation protein